MTCVDACTGKSFDNVSAFKIYFLNIDKCPNILKELFENHSAELWLFFMHAQSATFHQAVLKIKGQNVPAIDVANERPYILIYLPTI